MNNFKLLFLVFMLLTFFGVSAQDSTQVKNKPWYAKGELSGKIFANFHTSASDIGTHNAFEVRRAYFGYKVNIDQHFAAGVKLDIGNPTDFKMSTGDLVVGRRFAFFKNAYLQYKYNNFKVKFGIADAFQFKVQEKFWGYRYILPSYQDMYKFGSSADIGMFMSYKFADWVSADYSLNNGEGYGYIQNDDQLKNTLGVTVNPIDFLTLRVYGDIYGHSDTSQISLATFAGVKFSKFSIGTEYNYQQNHKSIDKQNFYGYSVYGKYNVIKNMNVFARFDHLQSDVVDSSVDTNPWNLSKDGDFIIGGVEYCPIKNVNLALNYRYTMPKDNTIDDIQSIYVNVQVKF